MSNEDACILVMFAGWIGWMIILIIDLRNSPD